MPRELPHDLLLIVPSLADRAVAVDRSAKAGAVRAWRHATAHNARYAAHVRLRAFHAGALHAGVAWRVVMETIEPHLPKSHGVRAVRAARAARAARAVKV